MNSKSTLTALNQDIERFVSHINSATLKQTCKRYG